jgi:hypothetical protein
LRSRPPRCSPECSTTKSRMKPTGGLAARVKRSSASRKPALRVVSRMVSVTARPMVTSVIGLLSATMEDSSRAPSRVGSVIQVRAAAAQADRVPRPPPR